MRWRSNDQPELEERVSADGLDESVWEEICNVLAAAHKGDRGAFVHASERLTQALPLKKQRLAGAYIHYLLQYRVIDLLGRKPTLEDLHDLASRASEKYARLLTLVEDALLEDTLRTTFKLVPPEREVKGGRFAVSSSATLGVLLDDPQANLQAMRPHLAEWWHRNAGKFRDLGVM